MQVRVDWVDGEFYGNVVTVTELFVSTLCGESAMNYLFEQIVGDWGAKDSVVVLFKREDLKYCARTASSSLSVDVFANDNFKWYIVDKAHLMKLLEK